MRIIEPGHIYKLDWLDGKCDNSADELIFVSRETTDAIVPHAGTQTQEVLRALIDRTQHCDACLRWEGNDLIVYHLRMALALHEARAVLRKTEKGVIKPEHVMTGVDGHFVLESRR